MVVIIKYEIVLFTSVVILFLFISSGCDGKKDDPKYPLFSGGGSSICQIEFPEFERSGYCEFELKALKDEETYYYSTPSVPCEVVDGDTVRFVSYVLKISYDGSVIEKVKIDGPGELGGEWTIKYPTTGTDEVVCKGAWGDGTGDYDWEFIMANSGPGSELNITIEESIDDYFPASTVYQTWKVIVTERLMGYCSEDEISPSDSTCGDVTNVEFIIKYYKK